MSCGLDSDSIDFCITQCISDSGSAVLVPAATLAYCDKPKIWFFGCLVTSNISRYGRYDRCEAFVVFQQHKHHNGETLWGSGLFVMTYPSSSCVSNSITHPPPSLPPTRIIFRIIKAPPLGPELKFLETRNP